MKKRSFASVMTGAALVLGSVGLVSVEAGAATNLGNQRSTYFPPSKVVHSQALTWKTSTANTKLKSIIGTYPKSTGSTTRGINGKTVNFGCIAPNTANGVTTVFASFCKGVAARLKAANSGKTTPYTLKLTQTADSGSSQTTQVTDITTAVDTEHDFGLFLNSALGPVGTKILETTHVPFFGDFTTCGKTAIYGFDVTYDIETCTALESETSDKWLVYTNGFMNAYMKAFNVKGPQVRYAGLSPDTGGLLTYVQVLESQIKKSGVKLVGNSTTLPSTSASITDLSPYVTNIISKTPTIIGIYSADPTLVARLMGSLKQNGYKGNVSASCTSAELQNPTVAAEITGCMATATGFGYPSFGGKYWNTINKASKSSGGPATATAGFYRGWVNADIAVQGLKAFAAKGGKLTAEGLVNLMNNGWTYPGFGDVVAKQTYPYGKYNAQPCATLARESAKSKKTVPLKDLTCGGVFYTQIGG